MIYSFWIKLHYHEIGKRTRVRECIITGSADMRRRSFSRYDRDQDDVRAPREYMEGIE